MAFTPSFLEQLKTRVGLADLVGKRVKLVRKGHEHSGLCPFHNEKSPSFTVNEEKGFYHCFGCGVHGGAIDFIMGTDGLTFPEAVERLARDVGMEIPQDTPEERAKEKRRQTLSEINEAATAYYEKMLHMPEGRAAMDYLRDRGLDNQTISKFRIGFAPDSRGGLKTALSRQNIEVDLMVTAGLLIKPDGGRDPYDRFRGRIMFPINDRRGKVIAFGGRIIGAGEPKYLNSPETPLFHKGSVLYNLDKSAVAARKAGTLIVTEGYMDVIALSQAGFDYAVAPLGTALTEDQIRQLWRVVKEPILCFDGDGAGQRAAGKAAERSLPLLNPGYGIRFATLPEGEDPDSLIKNKGRDEMTKVVDSAEPLSTVLWQMASGGSLPASPEKRAALQSILDDYTAKITNPMLRKHFSSSFKERLWPGQTPPQTNYQTGHQTNYQESNSNSWTANRRGGFHKKKPPEVVSTEVGRATHVDSRSLGQKILLATLINNPSIYDEVAEALGTIHFNTDELDKMRQEVLKTLAEKSELDSGAIEAHLIKRGFAEATSQILGPDLYWHAVCTKPDTLYADAIKGWWHFFDLLKKEPEQLEQDKIKRNLLTNPSDNDSQQIEDDLQKIMDLKRQQLAAAAEDPEFGG